MFFSGSIASHKRYRRREARCKQCGKPFEKLCGNHLFCSEECKLKARNGTCTCEECRKVFVATKPGSRFCSRKCYMDNVAR